MVYSLKNVKIAHGLSQETLAFTGNLYADNCKVAECSNHGTGGPNDVHFLSKTERERFAAYALELIAERHPDMVDDDRSAYSAIDFAVGIMVEDVAQEQWLKRQTRRKYLFRVDGDQEGAYRTIPKPNDRNAVLTHLRDKYGELLEFHG